MEKKFAEIDKKADKFKESIIKKPSTIRHSKDYPKAFDKISTRYNY